MTPFSSKRIIFIVFAALAIFATLVYLWIVDARYAMRSYISHSILTFDRSTYYASSDPLSRDATRAGVVVGTFSHLSDVQHVITHESPFRWCERQCSLWLSYSDSDMQIIPYIDGNGYVPAVRNEQTARVLAQINADDVMCAVGDDVEHSAMESSTPHTRVELCVSKNTGSFVFAYSTM